MSSLFRTPKIPKAPPVPTRDDAREAQNVADQLRRRRGGAAAILTGTAGDTSPVQTAVKTLTGQ